MKQSPCLASAVRFGPRPLGKVVTAGAAFPMGNGLASLMGLLIALGAVVVAMISDDEPRPWLSEVLGGAPLAVLDDEMLDWVKEEGFVWEGYIHTMYFELYTPESVEQGDVAERGTEQEESTEDTLEDALYLQKDWQYMEGRVDGSVYLESDDEQDFRTGESTRYTHFIKRVDGKPMSREEIEYIADELNIPNHMRNNVEPPY